MSKFPLNKKVRLFKNDPFAFNEHSLPLRGSLVWILSPRRVILKSWKLLQAGQPGGDWIQNLRPIRTTLTPRMRISNRGHRFILLGDLKPLWSLLQWQPHGGGQMCGLVFASLKIFRKSGVKTVWRLDREIFEAKKNISI